MRSCFEKFFRYVVREWTCGMTTARWMQAECPFSANRGDLAEMLGSSLRGR